MRGKGNQNQDEEEYEDEDFGPRGDGGPSSNVSATTVNHHHSNTNTCSSKDGKNSDRANTIRSKHSVTEQRRRIKINERFQILRELIPHGDQKRDTASFLLEVIEYVQYLQEKVQKYEATYQGWGSEPAKLMPWRNSHWRGPNFVGPPQAVKNGSGTGSTFAGRFDENNVAISPTMLISPDNPAESEPSKEVTCKAMEQQPEFANKAMTLSMSLQSEIPGSVQGVDVSGEALHQTVSDVQSDECPIISDPLKEQDELTVEGGTICVSSVYSEGLLNTLTQALQSAGIDLSEAKISVQIDLGKRANRGLSSGTSTIKDFQNPPTSNQSGIHDRVTSSLADSDQAQKRLKTCD